MNDKKMDTYAGLDRVYRWACSLFRFWYNLMIKAGKAAPAPELVLTEKAKAAEKPASCPRNS